MTENEIIEGILRSEGGYVDNPADRGGPTKFGITIPTLAAHRATYPASLNAGDIAQLSEGEARDIYRQQYIRDPGFDRISDGWTRAFVIDMGVLSGPRRAVITLQRALGLKDDGILGPKTLDAVNGGHFLRNRAMLLAERMRWLGQIITKNVDDRDKDGVPDNAEFAFGWFNRLARFAESVASGYGY